MRRAIIILLFCATAALPARALDRLQYNNPGLVVDLGVGLWAFPLPMDFNGTGKFDLVVDCPDKPYNGVYVFDNPGEDTAKNPMPVFKRARRISRGVQMAELSFVDGKPRVLSPAMAYPEFLTSGLDFGVKLPLPTNVHSKGVRGNFWRYVDFDGDGKTDIIVGADDWSEYGWDNAYDPAGVWTKGPLRGFVYFIRNTGTDDKPVYDPPVKVMAGDKPVETFGWPSPNFADFRGNGKLDLICGEFLDGFTFFENIGTRTRPIYGPGKHLKTPDGKPLHMDLEMITPVAIEWNKDGHIDLICGDEDGRVAFIENTGKLADDGTPIFLPPRYFRQEADDIKCGALATPVGFDWDGDGAMDILCGNSAGYIMFFKNLSRPGVEKPNWAAPEPLEVDGKPIRFMAGPNGSIQGPAEAKWGYTTFSVADWDGDGLPDLIVNSILGKVVWFKNIGTRTHPKLAAAQPIEVEWDGQEPPLAWGWMRPNGKELLTQWRTTPFAVDWNKDGLMDLVMLDQEGYLALFERVRRDGRLILLPPKRVFCDETGKPLQLAKGAAGKSGRRKICITDWDGDGKLDILVNSSNASFLRQIGIRDGKWLFKNMGPLVKENIEGHDVSPTVVDFNGDGIPDFLGGAEDGHLYYLRIRGRPSRVTSNRWRKSFTQIQIAIPPMKRSLRLISVALFIVTSARAEEAVIRIHADHVIGLVSHHLTGACLEDVNHEVYGGIYSQMIFGESFQEPAPSPAIKDFKVYGGKWLVQDGVVRIEGGDGPKLISDHLPFKDGFAGVEAFFSDRKAGLATLVVRTDKPRVGADKFFGYEVSLDAANQILSLARHRNNYEPLDEVRCEVAVGRWIPLEVKLLGSTIEISVDGKMVLRHHDGSDSLDSGAVGLRAWHRDASFRNFWVRTDQQLESLPLEQLEAPREVSGMWKPILRGGAIGNFAVVTDHPFVGSQSQQLVYESGGGEVGIENQSLNRWGMNFIAGKNYEGYVWVRAQKSAMLFASLESHDGLQAYDEKLLSVAAGDWQRLDFTLTPSGSDTAGRFALKLRQPGSVTIGHVFLQPGEWGRYKGLPVRRDVAEGLINQGVTILRCGGSMVNNSNYKWKKMIGPRDLRPPHLGGWYEYASHGWGIPDFMAFCEAARFEYVPAFNMGETPADMADFIDYAKAPADSEWGAKRAADGHPAPFGLRYMELGNEERVDEKYAEKFEALAAAIWAKDPKMILVVGDYAYGEAITDPFHVTEAASRITSLAGQQRILKFAKRHDGEVWFDVHVGTDHPVSVNKSLNGMFSFTNALDKLAEGARHKVVVFEFNSGNHAMKRALANALAINAIERDGRTPIVSVANCLQPDKQNDNGWDQGLLFLNPSQVWLQPPGYLTQMLSANYQPQLVQCDVTACNSKLDVNAKRSEDGKILLLQVVNPEEEDAPAHITLDGFIPTQPTAELTELSGPPDGANTAENPDAIVPKKTQWRHEVKEGRAHYTFPAHSVTMIRFE